MASSNQCGNCGRLGHYRSDCDSPKADNLQHWHAAKAKFRQEHPEVRQKNAKMWEDRRIWQNEGRCIPFVILNRGISHSIDQLYEMTAALNILGRPKEWELINKEFDSILPLVREILNVARGFVNANRLDELPGNEGEIFRARIEDLTQYRDSLVRRLKPFVNGFLKELNRVNEMDDPNELLSFIYKNYPPRFECKYETGSTLKKKLLSAIRHYHPDKQNEQLSDWCIIAESITKCLTVAHGKLK